MYGCTYVCSLKNEAEVFFEKMSEKDGGTYDAMIPAMVKVHDYHYFCSWIIIPCVRTCDSLKLTRGHFRCMKNSES